jgi:hypothetical protein
LARDSGTGSLLEGSDGAARRAPLASERGVTSVGAADVVRGCAEFTGGGALAAGRSACRVTVPFSEKSRSWAGPTVSDDGGGAAVTSTGASLFCANAGVGAMNASAAARPPNALTVMRRTAVTSPTSMVS